MIRCLPTTSPLVAREAKFDLAHLGRWVLLWQIMDSPEHREADLDWKHFFVLSTEMFFGMDEERRIVQANPAFEAVLNFERTDWWGMPLQELIFEDDLSTVMDDLAPVWEQGAEARTVARLVTKHGESRWAEWHAHSMREDDGRMVYVVARDMTLERQYDERFRLMVESAPNGILMIDEAGEIVLVNRQIEKAFGYNRDELIGRTVEALLPKRHRGGHVHLRRRYADNPEARPMGAGRDLFAVRKNGEEFPVEIGLTPIQMQDKLYILSVIVDITERKRAEAALRESAERAREDAARHKAAQEQLRLQAQILESVHDGVYLISPDSVILTWNSGAARIYGYGPEEMIGQPASMLGFDSGGSLMDRHSVEEIRSEGGLGMVRRHRRKNGEEVIVALQSTVLETGPGDIKGIIVCVNDITERKRLENKLLEVSESERRRIAMDIHDDLCQQLAGIACLTKVLEKNFEKHENVASVAAIGRMVAQANARARQISRGLAPPVLESDGLASALQDLAETTGKAFGAAIDVSSRGDSLALPRHVSLHLYRIAQEAVTNALKHGHAENIAIKLSIGNSTVKLSVTDDGSGMVKQALEQGKGMGVLDMKHRAQLMNGDLQIVSNDSGGTTVNCTIYSLSHD